MGRLTLNSSKKNNETPVSNVFLDVYMKNANGEFVKVYLYLLRCVGDSSFSLTISDIADNLNLTEKDVIRALKYWGEVEVISVDFDDNSNEPTSITFNPLSAEVAHTDVKDAPAETIIESKPEAPKSVSYSAAQIKRFKEQEEYKQLFYIIEKLIAKQLTPSDLSKIVYMKNDLGMSSELIEYLVEYCVTNEQTSLRYMEKVAMSWHDDNINTIDQAKGQAQIYAKRNIPIMKAFGIKNRNLTPAEIEFVDRWYDEYAFDAVLIVEACTRTIISMNKPNFNYTDGILRKWRSADIHTKDELAALDSGFRQQYKVPVGTASAQSAKNNRFNNFEQRTYDFDELEKKLLRRKKTED